MTIIFVLEQFFKVIAHRIIKKANCWWTMCYIRSRWDGKVKDFTKYVCFFLKLIQYRSDKPNRK